MKRSMILPRLASVCLLAASVGVLRVLWKHGPAELGIETHLALAAGACLTFSSGLVWWAKEWLFTD